MKTKYITALLAIAVMGGAQSRAAGDTARHVVIVANDQMKYSVTRIEARPGETIHVQLKNEGTFPKEVMGHNWVLLKSGNTATAYAAAAAQATKENYQPEALADQVLASIPLLGAKHEEAVTFTAPETPGVYPFLCTFPGHFQAGMHGELIVK
jgi:azurin